MSLVTPGKPLKDTVPTEQWWDAWGFFFLFWDCLMRGPISDQCLRGGAERLLSGHHAGYWHQRRWRNHKVTDQRIFKGFFFIKIGVTYRLHMMITKNRFWDEPDSRRSWALILLIWWLPSKTHWCIFFIQYSFLRNTVKYNIELVKSIHNGKKYVVYEVRPGIIFNNTYTCKYALVNIYVWRTVWSSLILFVQYVL